MVLSWPTFANITSVLTLNLPRRPCKEEKVKKRSDLKKERKELLSRVPEGSAVEVPKDACLECNNYTPCKLTVDRKE